VVSESWPDIRLLGVLNRIALCYLFTSLLFLNLRLPGLIVAFVAILAGYWALMTFVPVPGIGVGSYAKDANLANWLDAQYLPGRKWNGAWDPEGLLSTLPAIGTCLLGVFAGLLLKEQSLYPHQKTLWLIGAGAAIIALGVLWGLQFPIVKNIWTSSYVLVCAGLSALLLGVFHQVIDAWGRKRWATTFIWIGASAITLYLINGIVGFQPLATQLVGGDVGSFVDSHLTPGAGSLLAHSVGLLFAVALAGFLYRRKIWACVCGDFFNSIDPKRSFRLFCLTVQDGSGGAPHIVGTKTMRQEPAQVTRTERFCGGIRSRPAPPLAAVPRHGQEGSPRRSSDDCPQSCPRLHRLAA